MTANNLKFGSVAFCFEVYVHTIINGVVCAVSSAWNQTGLWDTNQEDELKWSKVAGPEVKLD